MEMTVRKPLQGITNIVRFNWHYYVISGLAIAALIVAKSFLPEALTAVALIIIIFSVASIVLSLAASFYIYDTSNLYSLNWLNDLEIKPNAHLVNIHAGFDETSVLLSEKFPEAMLTVFDFYDPKKHTEISIERARRAYPAFPDTKSIQTNAVPLKENSVDCIFLILSAHEIRNAEERTSFFRQLKHSLNTNGKIIVVEHQRDFSNFIVYNIGFFHFHSHTTWKYTFTNSGLTISRQLKITPFITAFTLTKNGTAS